jgi:transcriptional regulator with XRE-family HTH domain
MAAKIGQAELARRLGIESSTTMWRYEAGRARCPIDKLQLIAKELGVGVEDLLRGADGEEVPSAVTPSQAEYLRIAQLGLDAARNGGEPAIERFNKAVIEHAQRLRPPPKKR